MSIGMAWKVQCLPPFAKTHGARSHLEQIKLPQLVNPSSKSHGNLYHTKAFPSQSRLGIEPFTSSLVTYIMDVGYQTGVTNTFTTLKNLGETVGFWFPLTDGQVKLRIHYVLLAEPHEYLMFWFCWQREEMSLLLTQNKYCQKNLRKWVK